LRILASVSGGLRDELVEGADLGRFFERFGTELVGVRMERHRPRQRRLLRVVALVTAQRILNRRRRDPRRRVGEHRRLGDRFVAALRSLLRFLGEDLLEHVLAAIAEAIEAHAHAGCDRWPARIVLARPHHGAFARDQRRGIAQLELELHLGADCERLLGANEDAALTDIDRIAFDELLESLALELDLERDGRALPLSGVWIGQGYLPSDDHVRTSHAS
jgi:hypothetical protein